MTRPIVIVGEALGANEARYNHPFIGASGVQLYRMMVEASLITPISADHDLVQRWYSAQDPRATISIWANHPEVHLTNVFNIHPPRNDLAFFCGPKAEGIVGYPALLKSRYVRAEFAPQLDRLCAELLSLDPNIVICLGNTALWALAGRTGITKLRGTTLLSTHTVSGFKLLPTFHPAAILRAYENRPTVVADLMKASREASFPELRRPVRELLIEPTFGDLSSFYFNHILNCSLLSVDIETSGDTITCIGFAPSPDIAIVVPFADPRRSSGNYWPTLGLELAVWDIVRRILVDRSIPKLFQNGAYDISFLWRAYHIPTYGATHDTMLLHHAQQPEALKSLGYLGSIYANDRAWKHYGGKHETIKRDE